MKLLCKMMGINRSSFYYWKKRLSDPAPRTKKLFDNIQLFSEYHMKYPSHGYRWLNAKLRLDTGLILSDQYAHKCCKIAGIKSKSKHYKYKKPGDPGRVFPNLLSAQINIDGPLQIAPCHEPVHLRIMLRWSPSTAGSKQSFLRICISPERSR